MLWSAGRNPESRRFTDVVGVVRSVGRDRSTVLVEEQGSRTVPRVVDRVLHLIGFREANAGIAVTGRESSRGSGDEPVAGSHPADGCGPWVTVWNR
jgi:hypothetical protein